MIDLLPVFTRIVLRYFAGALVAWGLVAPEDAQLLAMDPDLALIVGAGLGAIVEVVYAWAKRHGGAT
jgi:hypothetical protein